MIQKLSQVFENNFSENLAGIFKKPKTDGENSSSDTKIYNKILVINSAILHIGSLEYKMDITSHIKHLYNNLIYDKIYTYQ